MFQEIKIQLLNDESFKSIFIWNDILMIFKWLLVKKYNKMNKEGMIIKYLQISVKMKTIKNKIFLLAMWMN